MSIGAPLFGASGGLPDPLAGMTLPPGDPASLSATAASYAGIGGGLEASASRQSQAAAGVGQAWIGDGAVSAQATVSRLGASAGKIATSANNAATALKTCAAGWEAAKAKWAQAQSLAAQAMAEEAAQRNRVSQMAAAGNPGGILDQTFGLANAYQSPLRSQAISMGQAAINEFNQATHTAKGALVGAAAPITSPAPKAPPHHSGGLLSDLEGLGNTVLGGLETGGNAVLGFLGDPNNLKVFSDLGQIAGGLGLIVLGTGGEIGGGALDITGVGALAGVPLNIASAGAIAGGAGLVTHGALPLGSDITHMSSGDGTSSGSGSPQPTTNFTEPTNPPQPPPAEPEPGYSVRVMPPTSQYPDGYWVETNAEGQPIDPSTGKPPSNVTKAQSRAMTHVPLPPAG